MAETSEIDAPHRKNLLNPGLHAEILAQVSRLGYQW
jgi:hypothetical protein